MKPYYEDDSVTIYHGDCREILPTIGKVDLLLTDPPYGISYNCEPTPQAKHQPTNRLQVATVHGDDKPFDPQDILAAGSRHIIWGGNFFCDRLPPTGKWIAWDKVTKNDLNLRIAEIEFAWTDCIQRPVVFRHLWSGNFRASEQGSRLHPTQKPVALMLWCLGLPGSGKGTVLDPFMGSGPVLRAAKDLGRKAIGIEIEERYCEIAANRCAQECLPFE